MDISRAVRLLRKQHDWTQSELAFRAHTTKSNISNFENANHGYSPALLTNLAAAFGCKVSYLFQVAEQLEDLVGASDETVALSVAGDAPFPIETFFSLPVEAQKAILILIGQIAESCEKNGSSIEPFFT